MNFRNYNFKYLTLLVFASIMILSCKNENEAKPAVRFVNKINFGKIKYGRKIIKTYNIKNVSKKKIVIYDIKSSCGCTVPKISDSIILPNKIKKIDVEYNPKISDTGKVNQTVVVKANTKPNFWVLYLEGEVIK